MNSASTNFVKQSIGHEDRLNFYRYILGSDLPPPRGKTSESVSGWLYTVFIRLNAAAFIKFFVIRVRLLFERGVYFKFQFIS